MGQEHSPRPEVLAKNNTILDIVRKAKKKLQYDDPRNFKINNVKVNISLVRDFQKETISVELVNCTLQPDPNGTADRNERRFFSKLVIEQGITTPQVTFFEEGFYYEKPPRSVISSELFTESNAQIFLGKIKAAKSDNEIDLYGLTKADRQQNREFAALLRTEAKSKLDLARYHKDIHNEDGFEKAVYIKDGYSLQFRRKLQDNSYYIDFYKEDEIEQITDEPGKTGKLVRPRRFYSIPAVDSSKIIYYQLLLDPVDSLGVDPDPKEGRVAFDFIKSDIPNKNDISMLTWHTEKLTWENLHRFSEDDDSQDGD